MSYTKEEYLTREEEEIELYGRPEDRVSIHDYDDELPTTGVTMSTSTKVEDMVSKAIRETMAKRKGVEATTAKDELPAEDSPIPVAPIAHTLADGEAWADKILNPKSTSKSFPVRVFNDTDWPEEIRGFIPKINEEYILPKDESLALLRAWTMGDKTLMYGPTGAGKSSLVEQLCARTRRPFVRVNCSGDMDSSMIFGQLTASGGSTVWMDGPVTEAVKHGAVFAWDEWDVTPPEIGYGLQWLLEDDGKLFLKEKPGSAADKFITPHAEFRLVAIGNTQGQGDMNGSFAGTNVQSTAMLDRFGTTVHVDYMPEKSEVAMIAKRFPDLNEAVTKNIVKFGTLIRQAYKSSQLSLTMSPRALISVANKVSFGCTVAQATELVYINKLTDTNQKVAKELFRKVFGV